MLLLHCMFQLVCHYDKLQVLPLLCCDKATFTGCTSRSVLCRSGPVPSAFVVLCLFVSLTHTGLQHRCLGPLYTCARLLLAPSRTASQFVTALLHISPFSALSPLLLLHWSHFSLSDLPFAIFKIVIKSVE